MPVASTVISLLLLLNFLSWSSVSPSDNYGTGCRNSSPFFSAILIRLPHHCPMTNPVPPSSLVGNMQPNVSSSSSFFFLPSFVITINPPPLHLPIVRDTSRKWKKTFHFILYFFLPNGSPLPLFFFFFDLVFWWRAFLFFFLHGCWCRRFRVLTECNLIFVFLSFNSSLLCVLNKSPTFPFFCPCPVPSSSRVFFAQQCVSTSFQTRSGTFNSFTWDVTTNFHVSNVWFARYSLRLPI